MIHAIGIFSPPFPHGHDDLSAGNPTNRRSFEQNVFEFVRKHDYRPITRFCFRNNVFRSGQPETHNVP